MRRYPRWSLWAGLFTGLLLVCGCMVMVIMLAQPDPQSVTSETVPAHDSKTGSILPGHGTPPRLPPQARRMRVAGLPGFFVVIDTDGSSYMEDPEGKRTPLADADSGTAISSNAVSNVVENMTAAPRKLEVRQLIVCDEGVVDVPKGVIITFIGKDKVVTHDPDGNSTTYYLDGRIVRRDRVERKAGTSTGREPK